MVLVPPGCFMMGENGEGCKQCFDKPFWMDKYEVTNKRFAQLGGQAANPSRWAGDKRPREQIILDSVDHDMFYVTLRYECSERQWRNG